MLLQRDAIVGHAWAIRNQSRTPSKAHTHKKRQPTNAGQPYCTRCKEATACLCIADHRVSLSSDPDLEQAVTIDKGAKFSGKHGVSCVCVPLMVSCSGFGLPLHAHLLRLFVTRRYQPSAYTTKSEAPGQLPKARLDTEALAR